MNDQDWNAKFELIDRTLREIHAEKITPTQELCPILAMMRADAAQNKRLSDELEEARAEIERLKSCEKPYSWALADNLKLQAETDSLRRCIAIEIAKREQAEAARDQSQSALKSGIKEVGYQAPIGKAFVKFSNGTIIKFEDLSEPPFVSFSKLIKERDRLNAELERKQETISYLLHMRVKSDAERKSLCDDLKTERLSGELKSANDELQKLSAERHGVIIGPYSWALADNEMLLGKVLKLEKEAKDARHEAAEYKMQLDAVRAALE